MLGHFSTDQRGRTGYNLCDKIAREGYFLGTYCRNSSHFSSRSSALANTDLAILYVSTYRQPSFYAS